MLMTETSAWQGTAIIELIFISFYFSVYLILYACVFLFWSLVRFATCMSTVCML